MSIGWQSISALVKTASISTKFAVHSAQSEIWKLQSWDIVAGDAGLALEDQLKYVAECIDLHSESLLDRFAWFVPIYPLCHTLLQQNTSSSLLTRRLCTSTRRNFLSASTSILSERQKSWIFCGDLFIIRHRYWRISENFSAVLNELEAALFSCSECKYLWMLNQEKSVKSNAKSHHSFIEGEFQSFHWGAKIIQKISRKSLSEARDSSNDEHIPKIKHFTTYLLGWAHVRRFKLLDCLQLFHTILHLPI
jgi:hypothetical protein